MNLSLTRTLVGTFSTHFSSVVETSREIFFCQIIFLCVRGNYFVKIKIYCLNENKNKILLCDFIIENIKSHLIAEKCKQENKSTIKWKIKTICSEQLQEIKKEESFSERN